MADGTAIAGRYELRAELGRGGFGAVFRAYDRTLGRDVAVKIVSFDEMADPDGAMARFRQEARAVAGFNHPNIVTAHDFGEHDGAAYLVMELVTGGSLADEHARARSEGAEGLPIARVRSVADQVCAGLGAAHAAGLVHRDLKPANIMLAGSGVLKIVDFGIVWVDSQSRLTRDGEHLGTLRYAAPEQLETGVVDGRADLYSLGCVLYELLTGRSPYRATTPADWIAAHLSAVPTPLRALRPEIPDGLAALVHQMLAKDPSHRPADAEAVRKALGAPDEPPIVGRARLGRANANAAIPAANAGPAAAAAPRGVVVTPDPERAARSGDSAAPRHAAPPGRAASGSSGGAIVATSNGAAGPAASRSVTSNGAGGVAALGSATSNGAAGPAATGSGTSNGGPPRHSRPAGARVPTRPYTVATGWPPAARGASPANAPTAYGGQLPPYPTVAPPHNGMATAGLVCGILPLPPLGFTFGLIGVVRAKRYGGAGRVRGALGMIFAVLWAIPLTAGIGSGLDHLSRRLDPACISAAVYAHQFDARIRADGSDTHAIVVELTAAANELRADAAKSNHPNTATDMLAFARDVDTWRADINAGRKPSAALSARLAADPEKVAADCS